MEFHQLDNVSTYVVQRFIFIFSIFEVKNIKICAEFSPQKILSSDKNLPLKKHGDEGCHLSWGVICFSYILLLLDFSCI
jgi:hypothetical protein